MSGKTMAFCSIDAPWGSAGTSFSLVSNILHRFKLIECFARFTAAAFEIVSIYSLYQVYTSKEWRSVILRHGLIKTISANVKKFKQFSNG